MADTQPMQYHIDNETFSENGHTGRFILPSKVASDGCSTAPEPFRKDSASTRFLAGRAPIVDFTLRFGDTSQNDRNMYPNNLPGTPQRAMKVYEGDAARVVAPGRKLFISTALNLLPTYPAVTIAQRDQPWWDEVVQWNVPPIAAQGAVRWRSPVCSLGLIWDAGVEYMTFAGRKEPAFRSDQGIAAFEGRVPVQRVQHGIRIEFEDGHGGAGSCKFWVRDQLVADYSGPLGYLGYGNPYSAHGDYRSVNSKEVRTIRFEGFTEGLMT